MPLSTQTTDQFSSLVRAFDGPLAVIFGASGGVGSSCSRILAHLGYATVLVGRDEKSLRRLASEIDAESKIILPCGIFLADITVRGELDELLDCLEQIGRVDLFLYSAGITSVSTLQFTDEELDQVVAVNFTVPLYASRRIIPLMSKSDIGYVINIASRASLYGFADKGLYGSSKAGALRFFDSVYAATFESKIRVTSICPGWIDTKMAKAGGSKLRPDQMLKSDDIASTVAWLISSPPRVRIRQIEMEAGAFSPA